MAEEPISLELSKGIVPENDLPGSVVPQGDLPQPIQDADSANAVSAIMDTVRGYAEPAFDMVKKSALPIGGQIAGGILGAPAGPVGAIAGSMAGAAIGEMANQLVGITEKSLPQVALAGAMPGVASAAMGTLKLVGGSVLKAFGGRQAIADVAGDIMKRLYSPKISADDLYSRALLNNGPIQARQAAQAVDDILRIERGNAPTETSSAIIKTLEPLEDYFKKGDRNIGQLDAATKDLRLAASTAYKAGNARIGNTLSQVRNSLFDDAANSGNTTLREAAKAARGEHAVEELAGILRQAQPLKALEDAKVKNKLFKGWYEGLGEGADKQIENLIGKLATAAPSGFSGVLGRSLAAGAGAPAGGLPGALAGGMLPDAAAFALRTQAGRNFMGKLLTGQGIWDAPKTAVLLTWVRAQAAEDAQAGEVAERVKMTLKDGSVPLEDKIRAAMERHEVARGAEY